jgi:D-serine deaminase-like pyridoxal phosphate-dependent protein
VNATALDTPALYVDLDVLERNIRTMQARCREWGVARAATSSGATGR